MVEKSSIWATGRRKTAIARVRIVTGEGKILVNRRDMVEYFPREAWRKRVRQSLDTANAADRFDVHATLTGGGLTGQAEALSLGIARALEKYDSELRHPLKAAGLLRRDARIKERKKYGQRGARARYQFSKR
ncbi:MAG: 30S ribosomal protein S9 [bacterium]|nr:30S ribosomal protein S9 [bacterium]